MNRRTPISQILFLLLSFVLFGCSAAVATPEAALPLANAEPTESLLAAVVMGTAERYNEGDLEGAMSSWADDAVFYMFGMPPTGSEMALGQDEIRATFEENIANNARWEVAIDQIKGNIVRAHAKNWHDFTRQIGAAPLEANTIYVIEDGKIVNYTWILSEESALKLKAALAEVMPVEPEPEASAADPVSELTITIAGQTCSYDGPLALQAGVIQLTVDVQDIDKDGYAVSLFTLDEASGEGKDFIDLMASTYRSMPPSWSKMIWLAEVDPGSKETFSVSLTEGPVYMICWVDPPEEAMGNIGPFEVSP